MIELVVGKLVDLLPSFETVLGSRRDMKDNALRAISKAIDETCLYYRDIEKGKGRNLEVEAQLCHYWSAAAIPLRHFDSKLAEICDYKSEYWVNPDTWDKSRTKQLGIELSEVRAKYRLLLSPKRFSTKLRRAEQ